MKIVFIASKTSGVLNFRGQLLKDIKSKNYEVVVVVPEKGYDEEFKKMGVKNIVLNFDKSSLSVFSSFKYFLGLRKILKEEKPDKVFSYTIKPVIFGSIAAHFAKVKEIYSLVCGLGYVYAVDSFKTKILRIICGMGYKLAFMYNKKVIFQNQDDIDEFVNRRYLKREKCELVNGSGVDLIV